MGPEDKRDDQENLLCVKVERMDYYRGWNQPAVDTISDAVIQFKRPNVHPSSGCRWGGFFYEPANPPREYFVCDSGSPAAKY